MIVVDSSTLVDVLLGREGSAVIARRLLALNEALHAPHLIDLEVTHALRRFALTGALSEARGREAFATLADLPMERHAHAELLPRVWKLRRNLTAYDAIYVALAEMLGATLLTRDARIAAAPGHAARIELV